MKTIAGILAFIGIIGFVIYLEVGVWRECLAENSFFYCMRMMSK